MSDLVSIASGAVSIYQRALATVSNNIANVDTEGYTRQELDQKENNTRQYGTSFFGTGAYLAGVRGNMMHLRRIIYAEVIAI